VGGTEICVVVCRGNRELCGCLAVHRINYAEQLARNREGAETNFHYREIRRLWAL
jgi:hypothetical protein